jgi:hypothetical protein
MRALSDNDAWKDRLANELISDPRPYGWTAIRQIIELCAPERHVTCTCGDGGCISCWASNFTKEEGHLERIKELENLSSWIVQKSGLIDKRELSVYILERVKELIKEK